MDVSGALPEGVWFEYQNDKIMQPIDYEKIPFRCWKFHVEDHIVIESLLNKVEEPVKEGNGKDKEGFVFPNPRSRASHRNQQQMPKVSIET